MKRFMSLTLMLSFPAAIAMGAPPPAPLGTTASPARMQAGTPPARPAGRKAIAPTGRLKPQVALEEASPTVLARVQEAGLKVLQGRFLAGEPAGTDFKPLHVSVDPFRYGHVHVQQMFRGIPVFEGEAIVHFKPDGSLFDLTDNLHHDIALDTNPSLSAEEAIDVALEEDNRPGEYTAPPKAQLMILARGGQPQLVYRVELRMEDGSEHMALPILFIDAHSGELAMQYDNLESVTGTGYAQYSGRVNLETLYYSPSRYYYLEDTIRRLGTFDGRSTLSYAYRFVDNDNVWDTGYEAALVDAHFGVQKISDYLWYTFGRNNMDGAGGPSYFWSVDGLSPLVTTIAHYGSGYNNAFWNGFALSLGDGDGSAYGPLTSVDIVGHEFTHGLTQFTAGLTYSGESGALNESMSDVFGTLSEFYTYGSGGNWMIGEDSFTPANGWADALRFMNNPHQASNSGFTADDDPDHYSERYTGSGDNGGVHINSGIANKAFYLLSQGGAHHRGGSMTGIGITTAAKIWYIALTRYMTSGTNLSGARAATLRAASETYGLYSNQWSAVGQAWTLCGVY